MTADAAVDRACIQARSAADALQAFAKSGGEHLRSAVVKNDEVKLLRSVDLARPPRASRHLVGNIVVEVESPSSASAFSVILLFTGKADPDGGRAARDEGPPLVGTYRDRFVLTGEGWRFAERHGDLTFR